MLFIRTHIGLRILEGNVLDHGKRVRMMGRRQPSHLRLESACIHRQGAVENASGDRSGHGSAMLAALDHCHDNVFWLIKRSKAAEPGNGILLAIGRSLGRSGFTADLYALQSRPSARPTVFVYYFPKSTPHHLDLFRSKIRPQIPIDVSFGG